MQLLTLPPLAFPPARSHFCPSLQNCDGGSLNPIETDAVQDVDTLASALRANNGDEQTNKKKRNKMGRTGHAEARQKVRGVRGCSYTASSQSGTEDDRA